MDILAECNVQHIFSAASVAHNFDLQQTVEFTAKVTASKADMPNLFVSDASDTNAFNYKVDGTFEFVEDFEFTPEQA